MTYHSERPLHNELFFERARKNAAQERSVLDVREDPSSGSDEAICEKEPLGDGLFKEDLEILAKTIYGEARGELYKFGIASLIAVANVVLNRKKKNFAPTIRDVCLAPYQFSCWNKNDPNCEKVQNITKDCCIFRKCLEVAENVLSEKWPDLTDGCDHYHHRDLKPHWAAYLEPRRIFGSHYFYALRNK